MSENEQKTDEQIISESPFATPVEVSRNSVSGTLTNFVGKRNDWKDRAYAAFQIEAETFKAGTSEYDAIVQDPKFLNGLVFVGKTNVLRFINTILRRIGQDNVEDAIPETGDNAGVFQMDVFVKSWENLQAASLKLNELVELYNEAVVKFSKNTSTIVERIIAANGDKDIIQKLKEENDMLAANVNAYKQEYEIRKAKRSKEVQAETVTPN